jgi:hypothetical protein
MDYTTRVGVLHLLLLSGGLIWWVLCYCISKAVYVIISWVRKHVQKRGQKDYAKDLDAQPSSGLKFLGKDAIPEAEPKYLKTKTYTNLTPQQRDQCYSCLVRMVRGSSDTFEIDRYAGGQPDPYQHFLFWKYVREWYPELDVGKDDTDILSLEERSVSHQVQLWDAGADMVIVTTRKVPNPAYSGGSHEGSLELFKVDWPTKSGLNVDPSSVKRPNDSPITGGVVDTPYKSKKKTKTVTQGLDGTPKGHGLRLEE